MADCDEIRGLDKSDTFRHTLKALPRKRLKALDCIKHVNLTLYLGGEKRCQKAEGIGLMTHWNDITA